MILPTPPMTPAEELDLLVRAKAGDDAAIVRILSSLVRLINIDVKRWSRGQATEQDAEDLMQLALMGTVHAIGKFDPAVGVRFSTYAQHWWTQHIRRESKLQFAAGRSGVKSILFTRYYTMRRHMEAALADDDPVEGLMRRSNSRRDVAEAFIAMHHRIASLDAAASDEDGRTLENVLADPREPVDQALGRRARDKAVRIAVDSLPEKMRLTIIWRHMSRHPMSFEAIGQQFGVTRQRAQQLEIEALGKLRVRLGGVNAT